MDFSELPAWERLLAAERHLQALVQDGATVLVEVVERLAAARPSDAPEVDLRTYKGLTAPWNDWTHLASRGRTWAVVLSGLPLGEGAP